MDEPAHPFDLITVAAPTLREWRETVRDDSVAEACSLLAEELVRRARHGVIAELSAIAPAIEQFLRDLDENDEVSLSLIENLQASAEEHGLNTASIRDTLGPRARQVWVDLYQYRHQTDLCSIDFDAQHIGRPIPPGARLEAWLVKPGAYVPADTALAGISAGEASSELRIRFAAYINRFAASAGQDLNEGDLLLYVMPAIDAHLRPPLPYCLLHPRPPYAAA